MFKIIEGDYTRQAAVYMKKGFMVPQSQVALIEGNEIVKYVIRDCFKSLEEISADKKASTIKVSMSDGKNLIAKVDKKTLEELKIQMALGPTSLESQKPETQPVKNIFKPGNNVLLTATDKKKHPINIVIIGLMVTFVMAMLFSFKDLPSNKMSNGINPDKEKANVWTYCHLLVQNSLKSPRSAKFPWAIDVAVSADNRLYSVNSWVDAENSFGATVRAKYVCRLEYAGGGSSGWTVKELSISQ